MKLSRRAGRNLIVCLLIVVALLFYCRYALLLGGIPPDTWSMIQMKNLHEGIVDVYYKQDLEKGLERLIENYPLTDGWDYPLIIKYAGNVPCRIISYGSDGIPGGAGDAIDLVLEVDWENDDLRLEDIKEVDLSKGCER